MEFFKKYFMLVVFTVMFVNDAAIGYDTYYVEDHCQHGNLTLNINGTGVSSTGILKATRHTSYSLRMNCNITLIAPASQHVLISFRDIDFSSWIDGSCIDYIQIYGSSMCKYYHSVDEEHHFQSLDQPPLNAISLQYHVSSADNKSMTGFGGFTLTFTAFRKANDQKECSENGTFLCSNNYCIWSDLTCDGHNNCGDRSDEDPFGNSNCGPIKKGATALIILGLIILCLLIIMCIATLMCTKNEKIRRFSARVRNRTLSFLPSSWSNRQQYSEKLQDRP